MTAFRPLTRIWLPGFLAALILTPSSAAEVYKCRGSDGKLRYQGSPCEPAEEGVNLTVGAQRPGPADTASGERDYSIEGQARRMQAEREALSEERRRSRRRAEIEQGRPARFDHEDDALRCARSREALLEWQRKLERSEPSDLDPITAQRQVEHYENLIFRDCD